jgi:hypothetical protein
VCVSPDHQLIDYERHHPWLLPAWPLVRVFRPGSLIPRVDRNARHDHLGEGGGGRGERGVCVNVR